MNNFIDKNYIEEINSQLKLADFQKNKLISDIYKEYDLYLKNIRDLLFVSVKKGIQGLFLKSLMKDIFQDTTKLNNIIEKELTSIINSIIPLITIEQLKILKNDKNINQEINLDFANRNIKSNHFQKNIFDYKNKFLYKETFKFHVNTNISNSFEYYQSKNSEDFLSIDLDNGYHLNNLPNLQAFENIGIEKQFITSFLELIEEDNFHKTSEHENLDMNKIDISSSCQNLDGFDLIDNSLSNLLGDFSYRINIELLRSKIIKKIISEDSFKYLVNKNFMIKHPYPFVINFEFNESQSLNNKSKPNIFLFNISSVELEYKNLNLSIQRNRINDLKHKFQLLIKKEKYWRQKKINLNKVY